MNKFLVPYNYLPFEFKENKKIFAEWNNLIKKTDFTLGEYNLKFEKLFCKYSGAKFCISTNNGTDALILALKSLNIKKNDEVITVTNSFYATTGAIVAVGATPVFADCDSRYQIDVNKIEKLINKRTKAILPVHWAGAAPDMKKIMDIAKKHNLYVVEDACMGIGGKYKSKMPGTIGHIGAYSMHPLKSLNVMGDGGAIVTDDKKIAKWLYKYRNHGMVNRDKIDFWGVNARLQPLQAIVAIEGLKKLDLVIKKRMKNASLYDEKLSKLNPKVIIPNRYSYNIETFSLYMILCKKRNKLQKFLHKYGIETKIHYPIPLHLQKASRSYKYKKGDFPVSEMQAKELLTLPVHQYLSIKQIKFTVDKIIEFYQND